jgi:hypothetical protein
LVCSTAILLASCTKASTEAQKSQEKIQWAGHALREVRTLRELPPAVQAVLGVGTSGLEGIADRNGKYNPTDVVDSRLPMRRFVIAGLDADSALVAVEHGGFGWGVEVALFSNTSQNPTAEQKWTLFESPKTLHELVDRLPPR